MAQSLSPLILALSKVGYIARREEILAVAGLFARPPSSGARGLLLEGPPGCGKTALAEAVAKAMDLPMVYSLLHAWSSEEELFQGIDVPAAVAGEAENVRQDGVLAVAAKASQTAAKYVVVCLDEIDKTLERTEALLLDWLQTGRVPVKPGVHLHTQLDKMLVFITSNGQRSLSDALLRRLRRVRMKPLNAEVCSELISMRAGAPKGMATLVWKAMSSIAANERGTSLSVQEGTLCTKEILDVAETKGDVLEILLGWSVRSEQSGWNDDRLVSAIYSEMARARRGT